MQYLLIRTKFQYSVCMDLNISASENVLGTVVKINS